jgi:hypothetical protein
LRKTRGAAAVASVNSNGLRDVFGFGVRTVVAVVEEIPGVGIRL